MPRFVAILFCFLILTTPIYAQSTTCTEHQCIAVIDAGSTGSRLHIYAYDLDETNSPIHINEIWNKKTKPGFATLEANANTIDAYLSVLMSNAPEQNMPIYFYATAGMRLVPPAKQKKYYTEVTHWFAQNKQWQLKDAKTITGNEEGLYDWLSVNYHLGSFNAPQNKSVGVMDMGGASVQIVFPITKDSTLNNKSQVELDLYGQHYTLFIHSFLGLGQTEMAHQFLNSASCFANDYPLPDGDLGQGNAPSCEQEVSMLMNKVHDVNQLVQPLLAANPVDSWYTIGGLSYLAASDAFQFNNLQLTSQNLLEQGDNNLCHQSWDSLNAQFPNDDNLYQYCLFSAYYYALMVDGYGIYPEQTINYFPAEQNIDWTIGVILHHR